MIISVVIPVYNDAVMLAECLEALSSQTRLADQIIVVDNNSTDESAAVAIRHGVTIIRESTQGIWAASAAGYNRATGDIIVRCDADTIPSSEWLEKIERSFSDNLSQAAVTGPGVFYDLNRINGSIAFILYMKAYFLFVGLALTHPPLFGSNFAMKSDVWRKVKETTHSGREDIHDDLDLSYHLGEVGRIRYDSTLNVGISGRPFFELKKLPERYMKGIRSVLIHWPEQAPWKRYRLNKKEK